MVGGEDYWRGAVVAFVADELIGVVLSSEARLEDLWLDPAFHRKGLGKQLLTIAEQRISRSGHPIALLNVALQNTSAISFYESNGWTQCETYHHERWGFSMVRMSKRLASSRDLQLFNALTPES